MKKFALILGAFLAFSTNAWAEDIETDEFSLKIKQETEQYKKDCFEKEAFPKGIEKYSMYNGDSKLGFRRYHVCLKKAIEIELKTISSPKDFKEMMTNIEQIQEGVMTFYWNLMNRKDNGTYGQEVNDIILGRYYEQLLEDIIHYKYYYQH